LRHGQTGCLAIIIVLVAFLPVLAKAHGESSLFQTALPTDKSSYKLGETVGIMLVLYNPTSQRIAVHFPNGCWFSFIVRDLSGNVVHNQTMSDCDPTINGLENVTNVMTVDAGGGRWIGMQWNQLDPSGKQVPVPADYVLSWGFKNPDQPIPEASARIALTDQVASQFEAVSGPALRFLQLFAPFLWLLLIPTLFPWSRAMKGAQRSSRIKLLIPIMISAVVPAAIILGFYPGQLVCLAIECPGTIALINTINLYLLVTPAVWAIMFLAARQIDQKRIWIPLIIFESWTVAALMLSFLALQAMEEIARDTFYYDWSIMWPSYALFVVTVPTSLLFYRLFKKKLLASRLFTPKAPKQTTFFDIPKS